MTAWHLLPICTAICVLGAYASYSEPCKKSSWFTLGMVALGAALAAAWAWAVKLIPQKESLYVYSLWWDSLMLAAYYIVPLIAFGVKPSAGVYAGAALVVGGLVVVKVYG